MLHSLAANDIGLERQHDAQFRQHTKDAVEGGGALLDKTLAGTAHHELALLIDRLEGHKAHIGPGDGLADSGGIHSIVLAAFAREAVGGYKLGGHQAQGVAILRKLACPMVSTGAGLHADQARRQSGDEFEQFGAWHAGTNQGGLAILITPCMAKTFFAKSIPTVTIFISLPPTNTCELMKRIASPPWHSVAVNRNPYGAQLTWDGEVPFIR